VKYVPSNIKLSPSNVTDVKVTIGAQCPHCKKDMRVAEIQNITLTNPPRRRTHYWCDECQIESIAEIEDNDSPVAALRRLQASLGKLIVP
jgi:hypothetical protein